MTAGLVLSVINPANAYIARMRRSRGFSATAENFLFSYFLANTTVTNDDDIELSTACR